MGLSKDCVVSVGFKSEKRDWLKSFVLGVGPCDPAIKKDGVSGVMFCGFCLLSKFKEVSAEGGLLRF